MTHRLTIVWDVDDVLNDLMRVWFEEEWRPKHPGCVLDYEGILDNPPHTLLGVDLADYQRSLDSFRLSGVYSKLKPGPEVRDWFVRRGHDFHHLALTATPLACASVSAEWVFRNFGKWIRSFQFIPSPRS